MGAVFWGGNCGTGVQASISKPTQFIYLAFEKMDPSYTWSSEMLPYSCTAFWLLRQFIAES